MCLSEVEFFSLTYSAVTEDCYEEFVALESRSRGWVDHLSLTGNVYTVFERENVG